jgi:acetoacetate decarboxylase
MQSQKVSDELNLKGDSMPLTPLGRAADYNNVPVKIGGRAMIVTFRPNQAEAAKYVPRPLELREPLGFGKVYNLVRQPVDEDLKASNPERTQYSEGAVGLAAKFRGENAQYNVCNWVDQEDALIRGREVYGVPKKLGKITMTRFSPIDVVGPGTELIGLVERHSSRIMTAKMKIKKKIEPKDVPRWGDFYHLRVIPSPDPEIPHIRQIVKLNVENVTVSDAWEGDGSLQFFDADNEELMPLQPEAILGAYYFNLSWTLPPWAKVVHSY